MVVYMTMLQVTPVLEVLQVIDKITYEFYEEGDVIVSHSVIGINDAE